MSFPDATGEGNVAPDMTPTDQTRLTEAILRPSEAADDHGPVATRRFRSLFVSDVHLGTKGSQAGLFFDFLRKHDADTLYIIGDLIDGWRLKRSWYWPESHNDVIQCLLKKGRDGTRIVYIPGNHDEFLRDYVPTSIGGVELVMDTIHTSPDGKKYLVIHGDEFDVVVSHAKWLALLGDWAYVLTMRLNKYVNFFRRRLGFEYWSLSAWAKQKVKNAVNAVGEFEAQLTTEAKRLKVDGVICGHIHKADDHMALGVRYLNSGDWVESCTALAEHADGRFEILRWSAKAATATDEAAALLGPKAVA
jgi:UDP-2,3-diacylglucosamine pyrophosphatase LpxH